MSDEKQVVEQEVVESIQADAAAQEACESAELALNSSEGTEANEVSATNEESVAALESASIEEAAVEANEVESTQVHFEDEEIKPLIESLLFAYGDPLSSKRLSEISKVDEAIVDDILLELLEESKSPMSGVELVRVAEKYQYRTKARFASAIRELKAGKPKRLSGAALETLAVIAYRQPVVKSDIEKIRGVDVAPTLKTLLERSLVKIIGHQPTVGQPALYGTTDEFLKIFSLNSLSELPSLRDVAEFNFEPGESDEDLTVEEAQTLSQ
jgi:segregation and condensation protein B